MKRVLALIICLTLTFCLCGCKGNKKKNENGIDIEYFVNLGQIPENDIVLGTTPENLKKALDERSKESEENGEDYGYNEIEGDKNVLVEEGPYDYYYKKDNPENGIGYIVSYKDAFGFKLGDIIVEVKKQLEDYNVESVNANEKNAFFYFGDYSKAQVLKITFEKNSVLFLFEDNALCATAVYSNEF